MCKQSASVDPAQMSLTFPEPGLEQVHSGIVKGFSGKIGETFSSQDIGQTCDGLVIHVDHEKEEEHGLNEEYGDGDYYNWYHK